MSVSHARTLAVADGGSEVPPAPVAARWVAPPSVTALLFAAGFRPPVPGATGAGSAPGPHPSAVASSSWRALLARGLSFAAVVRVRSGAWSDDRRTLAHHAEAIAALGRVHGRITR